MRVLIGGMIFMIKNVQFLDNEVCLYPLDTPFLFEVPYDDRALRDPDAPSLNEVARCMDITVLKARKLLITADHREDGWFHCFV